jgi:hypothetical protein
VVKTIVTWTHRSLGCVVGVMIAAGCSESASRQATFVIADSLGITITESNAPLWNAEQGWTISHEPEVVIGEIDGDERYLLSQVHGARRLSDGRIAVLDRGSARVRVYDPEGQHLFDVGGRGDGPSEFSSAHYVGLVNDSIVVYEYAPGSLTWFTPEGDFVRTAATPTAPDGRGLRGTTVGFMGDHSGVATSFPPGRPVREPGIHRSLLSVWRYDLRGSSADSLLQIEDDEQHYYESDGRLVSNNVLFGKGSYVTASDEWIYTGSTESYTIQVLDGRGTLRRIVRRVVDPERVTPDHLSRYIDQLAILGSVGPDQFEAFGRRVREMAASSVMPYFRLIVADSEQNLWVEDWHDVGLGQGAFSVFRPDGVWLGTVALPAGLPRMRGVNLRTALLEIGSDYVLGVWESELGVEQVRMYRIEKG